MDIRWWIDKSLFWGFLLPGPVVAALTKLEVYKDILTPDFGYPLSVFLFVIFLKGFGRVDIERRVVKEVFGYGHGTAESGPRWKVPFFGKFIQLPTTKVELEIPPKNGDGTGVIGVYTMRERVGGRDVTTINVVVQVSFQFEYPQGNQLISVVKTLPSPVLVPGTVPIMEGGQKVGEKQVGERFDFSDLAHFFEKPIADAVRDVGARRNYLRLLQERTQFAQDIHTALTVIPPGGQGSVMAQLIRDAGLQNVRLTIKQLKVPDNIEAAMTAEEAEQLKFAGTRHAAAGERLTRAEIERGIAEGRKARYDAARANPENIGIEALITQSEMAQGGSNTIFVPTRVMDILGRGAGRGAQGQAMGVQELIAALGALTPAQRQQVLALLGIQAPPTIKEEQK